MKQGKSRAALLVAIAAVTLGAAGCGGSHHHNAASGGSDQLTARSIDVYAACFRSHGVPNFYFTRTTPNSNGVTSGIKIGPWVAQADPSSSQFQVASKACRHLFPGGAPPPITQKQKEQMLQFAACMRVHGFPTYADPQFPPGGGVENQQPSGIDPGSPQFQKAAKTCNAQS